VTDFRNRFTDLYRELAFAARFEPQCSKFRLMEVEQEIAAGTNRVAVKRCARWLDHGIDR
jgi:putative component of membrane protein insertase Oxa1/YidC/SpoIIIJ protein YidD